MKKTTERAQLVLITWRDACTYSGWRAAKEARKETAPAVCESVGWLLENSADTVTIFATRAQDPEDEDINSLISIPAAWVTKMQVLAVRPARKIPVHFAHEAPTKKAKRQKRRLGFLSQDRKQAQLGYVTSERLAQRYRLR